MKNFNNLCKQLIEANTVGSVLGQPAISGTSYAAGDNRPIEPARIVIGAKAQKKNKKNKSQVMIPVQKRSKVETIFLKGK